jgi:cell division septum initiation protein DivIVA
MVAKGSGGSDMIDRLNRAISDLLSENRKLRKEVLRLTEKAAGAAAKTVKRRVRAISRPAKKAVARKPQPKPRRTSASAARGRKSTKTKRKLPPKRR